MRVILTSLLIGGLLSANEVSLLHPHKESIKKQSKEEIEATFDSQKND